jgi:hypothetical protein
MQCYQADDDDDILSQVVVITELNMFSYSQLEKSIYNQNELRVMNHNARLYLFLNHIP